jgi:hypothetical protein
MQTSLASLGRVMDFEPNWVFEGPQMPEVFEVPNDDDDDIIGRYWTPVQWNTRYHRHGHSLKTKAAETVLRAISEIQTFNV